MLNPALIFFITWFLAIMLSYMPFFGYYLISTEGLLFYFFGVFLFVLFYFLFQKIFDSLFFKDKLKFLSFDIHDGHRLAVIYSQLIFLILLPLYVNYVINVVGVARDLTSFFVSVRNMSTAGTLNLPFYVSNIPILSSFLTIITAVLYGRGRLNIIWLAVSIVLTVIYLSVTGSRALSVTVMGAVFIVIALLKPERSFVYVILGGAVAIFIMIISGLIFGRGGSEGEIDYFKGFMDFIDYFVNGIILFDNYLLGHAEKIYLPNDIFRFFTDTLASLKLYQEPYDPRYTVFYNFSTNKIGNVYTMYGFIYPVLGGFFTLFFIPVYSFIYALMNRIKKINLVLFCLYSILLSNLCLSIIKEPVFINLNYMIKLVIFVYFFDVTSRFILKFRLGKEC